MKNVSKKKAVKTITALFASLVTILSIAPLVCSADHLNNPAYNPNYQRIGRRTTNKKWTIGDVDHDGHVTNDDASLINQWCIYNDFGKSDCFWGTFLLKLTAFDLNNVHSPNSVEFMDINGDGKVTPVDATILLRYLNDVEEYERAVNG